MLLGTIEPSEEKNREQMLRRTAPRLLHRASWIPWLVLTALLLAIDQLTKLAAVRHLKGEPAVSLIPGVLELSFLENAGAAFGLFRNMQWGFVLFALIISGVSMLCLLRISAGRRFAPLRAVCALICAGALGNMLDRIAGGKVIDFIYISLINFPIFNLADIYVTVSCVLLLILLFFVYSEEELHRLLFQRRRREYLEELARKLKEVKEETDHE